MSQAKLKDQENLMEFVKEFHNSMIDNNLSLVYEGEVNQTIVKAFTSLAETNLDKTDESTKTKKTVYHVMVECLQNITKHADGSTMDNELKGPGGIFLVGEDEKCFTITTGNPVSSDRIPGLKEVLGKVNQMEKEELKKAYKEQMRNNKLSDKDGAGLGFIDIAKKTGNRLEYEFIEQENGGTLFILRTTVDKSTA
jgi:hypothetical protein